LLISSDEEHRRQHGKTIADFVKMGDNAMVERIRSLLAQFPEDEGVVRELVAKDASFDALCQEYRKVVDLLGKLEAHVKLLKERRAWLEEQLLMRIEGQPPQ
jgi:hypothetical protein